MKIKVISDMVCNNMFKNFPEMNGKSLNISFSPVDQFLPEIINSEGDDFLLVHLTQYAFNSYFISEKYLIELRDILDSLQEFINKRKGKVILNSIYFDFLPFSQSKSLKNQELVFECNNLIFKLAKANPSDVIFVDVAQEIAKFGYLNNLNTRNYSVMKFPYSKKLSSSIREKYIFHLQHYFNARKKVVFVDADNTLWGGVVGEDGFNGVNIGFEYPGYVFYYFQKMLLELKESGIVLCLISKNNLEDIEEIFNKRDMPLSMSDFVEVRCNWNLKSENINEVLQSLNVSSSSAVFIDDSQFEIEEVSRVHTDLDTIHFDFKSSEDLKKRFSLLKGLYSNFLTDEDLTKTQSYASQKKRKAMMDSSKSIESYLKNLNIKMKIYLNEKNLIPRITQLSQKTNQFNLTTKRYSEIEIEKLMSDQKVYAFNVEDKFGNLGIVGVVIIIDNFIETFLLSCRAFGRKIENQMLVSVVNDLNTFPISGRYIENGKNTVAKDFYELNGFKAMKKLSNKTDFILTEPFKIKTFIKDIKWV